MADRYSKDNILEYPVLAPERHYESENPPSQERPSIQITTPDPLLENLDDLDNVYKLADLLPADLARIVREITDVLSKHTQGLIIMRIQRQLHPETPETPGTTPSSNNVPVPGTNNPSSHSPETPGTTDRPGPGEPGSASHSGHGTPGDINRPGSHSTKPGESGGGGGTAPSVGPGGYIRGGGEVWPTTHDKDGTGGSSSSPGTSYISSSDSNSTFSTYVSGGEAYGTVDADIDDIFSSEPDVEIVAAGQDSLVELSRKAYEQDDADIKEHYTSQMSQITQRFYQVMTALAEDSNMLDYSDLMQDFDGTAVTTSDPNQRHLIDEICKNDILYDQMLRQMNLTHTAAKTLVMTRGMTAAEGERERYFGEEYKTNMPSIVASLSNDLLLKNRESAQKKYKESAYNYYKYLDSATKMTNAMLNMKIDSAIAKGQLANTGSNIFAYTPPAQPLADNVDDNYDTVQENEKKGSDFIKEQSKDSKKGSEVDSGLGGSNYSSTASAGSLGGGNVDPSVVYQFLKKCGYNAVAACGIMGNIQQESGFNTGADDGVEAFGLCQWTAGRQQALKDLANSTSRSPLDAGVQLDYLWQELQDYEDLLPSALNSYSSAGEAAEKFEVTFERAGVPMMENRISYANGFFQQFNGK